MFGRARPGPRQVQTVETHVCRGPEPLGTAAMDGIDANYGLRLAGAGGDAIRIGVPAYNVNRFSGDCGPIQNFGRGRFLGATPVPYGSLIAEQAPGLPGASAVAQANPVLAAMLTNGAGI